ncbi:helix-turn-helix domain-containing protein [Paraburkholderia sp. Ac-20336]|uniref:AraC family transcriptional regulator n=1 Tax=Paraburkholderia sp. Ac-20336 TaxID=2703886 RepID=UPI00197FF5BB|nr:helix-turn-helix domain-containing protein [Paraburkholderia sp. Ac-20336]
MASSSTQTPALSCTNPTSGFGAALSQRAVLLPQHIGQTFQLSRYPVGESLAPWAEFHWIVEWDLPEADCHLQQVLPYPNANLAFEAGQTAIHGPSRGLFTRELRGRGRVHGLRFKCGGLRPWIECPMSALRDTVVPAIHCMSHGSDIARIEAQVLNAAHHDEAIARVEAVLSERRPPFDPWVERLDTAVHTIQEDRDITTTRALLQRLNLSERAMQRVFSNYLGVTPKWLIQRARIHDALQCLAVEHETPLVQIGARLGFFDQAHFTRCFRQHTGQSPQQYREALRTESRVRSIRE